MKVFSPGLKFDFYVLQVLPDFSPERLHIVLGQKRASVTLREPPSSSRSYLREHPEKNTDPSKALTVPEHVPIAVDPYTKSYEEVMTTTDLLELESKPAMMVTQVKGKGRTLLPAKMVDPSLHPKRCPLVAAITGIRSIPLELGILDLD